MGTVSRLEGKDVGGRMSGKRRKGLIRSGCGVGSSLGDISAATVISVWPVGFFNSLCCCDLR
jgi:hypothetical protein